jgi:hypothetical protein
MALVRAKELVEGLTQHPVGTTTDRETKWDVLRERRFSGSDGKIVGRPDIVRPEEVVDFKTGDVFEDGDQGQIKDSYLRQLRIYGFLVRETLGWWPRRGVLLPMTGSPVEVDLDPGECENEAQAAVRLLEEYNAAIGLRQDPLDLASPSPTNCRGCPFQLYCPAFWSCVAPGWEKDLWSGAIEGRAQADPLPIYGGSALSVSIRVERGTVPAGQEVPLFPLDPSMHPELAQAKAGEQVRVTGLWRRADDSLVAMKRTMIALEKNLPRIGSAADGPNL